MFHKKFGEYKVTNTFALLFQKKYIRGRASKHS